MPINSRADVVYHLLSTAPQSDKGLKPTAKPLYQATTMQLITVENRGFNLTTLTHYAREVAPTETGGTEMACVLSFGCDDTLIFYGAEALQVWEMLEARSLDLAALNKARDGTAIK